MSFKAVNGYKIEFSTGAPKNGKSGPRILNHVWSCSEEDYPKVLDKIQNGFYLPDDLRVYDQYAFKRNMDLGANPKFAKNPPVWSGMAIVGGQPYECFVFKGTSIVMTD